MSFFYYWHVEEVVPAFSPLLVYFGTLLQLHVHHNQCVTQEIEGPLGPAVFLFLY